FGAGPRVVGNLVGRHASGGETLLRQLVHRGRSVLVSAEDLAARGAIAKGGAGLDRQLIKRNMRPGQAQRLAELVLPGRDALSGTRIDQVEGVSREGFGRQGNGSDRFVSTVTAAEKPQRRWIERLHTQGQAVDACRGKPSETLGLRR